MESDSIDFRIYIREFRLLLFKRLVTTCFFFIILLVIFYFGISMRGGAISGAIAVAQNPENAMSTAEQAGSLFAQNYNAYISISSLVMALISSSWLSFSGALPWCRPKKNLGIIEMQDGKALAQWGWVGTSLWAFVIATTFVILQLVTIFYFGLSGNHTLTEKQFLDHINSTQGDGVILSVSTFITTIVCSTLVVWIIKLKRGSNLTDYLAIRPVPMRTLLKWLGLLAVVIAASDTLNIFFGRPIVVDFMSTMYASTHPVWLIWIALIVAAPFFEEIFFRGFLLKGFASGFVGPTGAIVLTAALWAIIHIQYDAYNIATVFCLGLMFGAARIKTGSLLVPLAMHALANLVSTAEAAFFS